MAPTTSPPLLPDLLAGLGTITWYALPDYIGSPWLRGVAKVGILATCTVYGSAILRKSVGVAIAGAVVEQESEPHRGRFPHPSDAPSAPAAPSPSSVPTHPTALPPVILAIAAGVVLGGTAVAAVGLERRVYRFGERLSAEGVLLPHSRIGLVLGVVSTAAALGLDAIRPRTRPTDAQPAPVPRPSEPCPLS
jgi:hypothetical protein